MSKLVKSINSSMKVPVVSILSIVIVLFFLISCTNVIEVKGKKGNLAITLPGGRSASGTSYTVALTGANGTSQSRTAVGGQTVTFESLIPDTYTIVVEGKDTDKFVYYGTSATVVTAGNTSNATVNLYNVVDSSGDLASAVATGGVVYVHGDIDVPDSITIDKDVTILAAKSATLKNSTDSKISVTNGKLTLGDGVNSLTIDGGSNGLEISGGTVVMNDQVTIKNASSGGVKMTSGAFTMNGGEISNNKNTSFGGGVYVGESATFTMNGGTITGNTGSSWGKGIYVKASSNFSMSGTALVSSNNDVYLENAAAITVAGKLSSSTPTPVATISVSSEKYVEGTQVLKNLVGQNYVSTEYTRFAVTPQAAGTEWTISREGKLQQKQ